MALVPFPGTPTPYDGDPDDDESSGADKMSFLEHLDELRKRLIVCVSALAIGFVVCWAYVERLVDFIFVPLRATIKGGKFQYIEPGEGFMMRMKLAALAGLFLALPIILWQIWRFVAPGLYSNEKRFAIPFVFLSTVFFTLGAAFSHYIAFPWTMQFFASYESDYMVFIPTISPVFAMYVKMMLAMGLVFEMPTAVFFLARIGVVTQDFADAPEAAGAEALQMAAKAAERAGASVRTLALPEIIAEAWRIHPVIQEFEAHQALAWEYRENYDALAPNLRGRLDESKGGTAAEYDAAMGVASRARQALAKIFDDVDVILTLSAPGAAPKGLGSTGDARYNRLWTLMGVPCVNVPTLVAEGGLPVGVTVIARYGADAQALAAARFVEKALAGR